MTLRGALLFAALCTAAAGPAQALDFRSASEVAVLYDAPSQKAKPLFVIAAGTPVETIVALESWVKVRDSKGDLAWIERRLLSDKRMLQLREQAQVRADPGDNATVVFAAEPDVLLEFVEPGPPGWVKVRHRDGQQGYVKVSQVWGL